MSTGSWPINCPSTRIGPTRSASAGLIKTTGAPTSSTVLPVSPRGMPARTALRLLAAKPSPSTGSHVQRGFSGLHRRESESNCVCPSLSKRSSAPNTGPTTTVNSSVEGTTRRSGAEHANPLPPTMIVYDSLGSTRCSSKNPAGSTRCSVLVVADVDAPRRSASTRRFEGGFRSGNARTQGSAVTRLPEASTTRPRMDAGADRTKRTSASCPADTNRSRRAWSG